MLKGFKGFNCNCPQCGGDATTYEEEGRYYLSCFVCGYVSLLMGLTLRGLSLKETYENKGLSVQEK